MTDDSQDGETPRPPQTDDTPARGIPGQPTSSSLTGPATKSRKPWVIAGSVVAVFVAAAVALVVLGGGSDDDSTAAVATTAPDSTEAPATTVAETTTTTEATTTTIATLTVPRFGSGTTVEEAQAELTDLGLVAEVVEKEGPGPYGVVVDTEPRAGSDVEPGSTVALTVNTQPATMPSVIGETTASALDLLESYAIAVTTSDVLSENASDDTIIDQTPKPGEPFAADAQLVVNRRPAIVYLADLDRVDSNLGGFGSGFDTGQAQVNGTVYTRTVLLDPPGADPGFVEYDLARSFLRLVGSVGPRDDVSSNSLYKVEIFIDGTLVFDQTLGLGQVADVDVDVTNVLRLRLQVTQIEETRGFVAFTDPRLLGLPGSVPTTTGG